jgi:hypothetical protein
VDFREYESNPAKCIILTLFIAGGRISANLYFGRVFRTISKGLAIFEKRKLRKRRRRSKSI